MAQAKTSAKARMVVHDGAYRVLVLKNPEPAHEHDVVHAFCIDQNLAGRGVDVAAALLDLAETMTEILALEYGESQAEQAPNPDPELVEAYEGATNVVDGFPVIRRGTLRIRLELAPERQKRAQVIRPEEFTFTPLHAAIA